MAIDVLNSSTIKAMSENVASSRNVKRGTVVASGTEANNVRKYSADEVAFTDRAKFFAEAKSLADASDGIDYDKVAAIKAQIENGTYEVNCTRVAEKMVAFERDIYSIFQ